MSSPIYMELYVGDYLRDTAHLSPTHNGCYLLLIFHYWQKGMLQACPEQCARIARASTTLELRALNDVLAEFFIEREGRYINGRLEKELERFRAKKDKASAKASAAAEARWGRAEQAESTHRDDASRNAPSTEQALLAPCPPTPTPASTSKPKATRQHAAVTPGFEAFWAAYPVKKGRKDAVKAWAKIPPESVPAIMAALAQQTRSDADWREGFIPRAATYLNGERWLDEVTKQRHGATPTAPSVPQKPPGPSETPLERAIAFARHQHHVGAIDVAERDRQIANATEKHRGVPCA